MVYRITDAGELLALANQILLESVSIREICLRSAEASAKADGHLSFFFYFVNFVSFVVGSFSFCCVPFVIYG